MLNHFYTFCLQGDVKEAYQFLQNMNPSKQVKLLEQKYYNRFFKDQPTLRVKSDDPWIKQVVIAYYHYFICVLAKKASEQMAEKELIQRLVALLPSAAEKPIDLNLVENELKRIFNERGYYFLGGVTSPYRGPYIWKQMEKKVYQVELPHEIQEVTVFLMSDFIMLSWLHFATFGKYSTGGWAKEEGIYCVTERYKKGLESTSFEVSFLKHEAQHLNDFHRFPGLPSKDLEYRAKLVELIYNPSPTFYKKLLLSAKEDPLLPHSYASFVIKQHTNTFIMDRSAQISCIAKKLYDLHTEELLSLGKDFSKGII